MEQTEAETQVNTETQATESVNDDKQPVETKEPEGDKGLLETKPSDDGLLGEQKKAPEGAPEEYSEFTTPEDSIKWTDEDLGEFKSIARAEGMSQAEAQKGLNVVSKVINKLVAEQQAADEKFRTEQAERWKAQPDSDKRTVLAQEALDKRPVLKEQALKMGYLHDAAFVGLLAELGAMESEGTALRAGNGETTTLKQKLYPNSPELYKQ